MKATEIPVGRMAKVLLENRSDGYLYLMRFGKEIWIRLWPKGSSGNPCLAPIAETFILDRWDVELLPDTTTITLALNGKWQDGIIMSRRKK